MQFTTCINIPGYLPMDDDPPVFETAEEAWAYLVDERHDAENEYLEDDEDYSKTFEELQAQRAWHRRPEHICGPECVGTVTGPTPGYDGDHDLGFAYSVVLVEEPTPQPKCTVPADHHSEDVVEVHHGAVGPTMICGFHAQPELLADSFRKITAAAEYTTAGLQEEFEVKGFALGMVVVRRKSDDQVGTLQFERRGNERIYFGWVADR